MKGIASSLREPVDRAVAGRLAQTSSYTPADAESGVIVRIPRMRQKCIEILRALRRANPRGSTSRETHVYAGHPYGDAFHVTLQQIRKPVMSIFLRPSHQ